MRSMARDVAVLALSAVFVTPPSLSGQTGAQARALTPAEAESYEMSMELAFGCSPRRHNRAAGSESMIRRDPGELSGTAVFFSGIEGAFLVLEEYDEDLNGHCLVLGWFGGDLVEGRYGIGRLAFDTMEEQLDAGSHSFFSMAAIRTSRENSIIVGESGTLDLEVVATGSIEGRFDLNGFAIEGNERRGSVHWTGTFNAVEGER